MVKRIDLCNTCERQFGLDPEVRHQAPEYRQRFADLDESSVILQECCQECALELLQAGVDDGED